MKRIPLQPRTLKFIRFKSVYVERTARFYRGDSYQYLELLPTRVYKRLLKIAILRPQHSQVMENSVHTATLQANGQWHFKDPTLEPELREPFILLLLTGRLSNALTGAWPG